MVPGLSDGTPLAFGTVSTQALNSPAVQSGMKDILLNHAGLYEIPRSPQTTPPSGTPP